MRFFLIILSVLLLAGIEVRDYFSVPPARDWLATNLKEIQSNDSDNFSFAVFGDNKNSHSVFENLLDVVDSDPGISFAMGIGDMVFDGEKEKYRYFLEQIRSHLHKPLLTVLGNHELKDDGRALYYEIFGPFYYSFQLGKTSFIVLDDANEKGLDSWQKGWLEGELIRAQNSKQRLIFMHVPLYDPTGGTHHHCLPKSAADELALLFAKYNVTHIFASHVHGYFQGVWNGIPYTITGGAGAELWGNDPNHFFFHYIAVRIHDEELQIEVKHLPSPAYENIARMAYLVWLYVYALLRIHGIELALVLIIAGLAAPAYRLVAGKLRSRNSL